MPVISIGFNGMFYILPAMNIPIPVDPAPTDSARVSCAPARLQLTPWTQGTVTCAVTSQNGFFGTLSATCQKLVADGSNLTSQVAPDCTMPATVDLPLNGAVLVSATLSAGDYLSGGTDYLALYYGGHELQAPNDFVVSVPAPRPPPPQVNLTCQMVTQTAVTQFPFPVTMLVGDCTLVNIGTTALPPTVNVGFGNVTGPGSGGTSPSYSEYLAASEQELLNDANATQWNATYTLNVSGSSPTFWFGIRLNYLSPGQWQYPIAVNVASTTVTAMAAFSLAPDGTATWLG